MKFASLTIYKQQTEVLHIINIYFIKILHATFASLPLTLVLMQDICLGHWSYLL